MSDIELPAEMVERAARALFASLHGPKPQWYDDAHPDHRETFIRDARLALTAAFEGCEVEWAWRGKTGGLHSISAAAVADQGSQLANVRLVIAVPVADGTP